MRVSIGLGMSALSIALISVPAAASPESSEARVVVPPPVITVTKPSAKSQPSFEQMMSFFDKLFPPQPDPDPARLALARKSVAAMWPDGAYAKMMTDLMGSMVDRAMELKQSDFAALDKKVPKVSASAADKTVHDQAVAKDPYFDKRVAAIREVASDELVKVSAIIDPRIREGLARSMARRFDAQQLGDINAFFGTPSGHALASQSMQLWVDPDMMRSLFGSMPEMMKLMPEMMQKIKAANDKYPKPPKAPAKVEKH